MPSLFQPLAKSSRLQPVVLALAASLILSVPSSAFAQESSEAAPVAGAEAESDSARLEALDEKLRILERKLEVKEEEAAAKAQTAAKAAAGPDGFILKSADDEFALRWRGLLQIDYRGFLDGADTGSQRTYLNRYPNNFPGTFIARKVRPSFDVTLGKFASFRIVPEFGGGSVTLLDAYGELAFRPEARLRVGKFTAPLGIERLQSASDNFFAEYALTSNLTRNRDIGAQLSGDLLKEALSYSVGVFNGAVDGANKDNDSTDHKDVAGRVFALPFRNGEVEALRNLGFGVAGAWGRHWGDSINPGLPVYRTPGQNTFFTYRAGGRDSLVVQARGTYYSLVPQGYWFVGSFGILGEYAYTSQEANIPKSRPAPVPLETRAWFASAVYVLTGELPSYRGLKPRHPVTADGGGLGALELVARVGGIETDLNGTFPAYADSTRSAREALSIGGGVNWHLSRFVKWTLDYEHTRFTGGNRAAVKDRDDEKVLITRLQFTY